MPGYRALLRLAATFATAASLTLSGCGKNHPAASGSHASSTLSVTDDSGQTVSLKQPARRIVTIEPSNTEIALDLGLKARIAGVDAETFQFMPNPWHQQLTGIANLGNSYPKVNAEAVVKARPDLVVAGSGVSGLAALKALHIPVLVLNPTSVSGVFHDIQLVGDLTGTAARASKVVSGLKSQMDAIQAAVARAPHHPTVFYDLGDLYTAGPHTFIDSLIQDAGGVNLGSRLSGRQWPKVTLEQVIQANPDVILINANVTTPAKEAKLPGMARVSAVANHHIAVVSHPSYIDQPSPALVDGLRELAGLLHPGLKLPQ